MENPSRQILFEKAKQAYASDQYSECVRLCRIMLDRDETPKPERILVMHLLADVLLDLEQYTEAIDLYSQMLTCEMNDIALANRGFALMELKQWDRALNDYLAAIRINPDNVAATGFVAECYFGLRKFPEAISFLLEATAKTPLSGKLHAILGNAYSFVSAWPEAHSAYQRAIDLDPSDVCSKRALLEIEKSAMDGENEPDLPP